MLFTAFIKREAKSPKVIPITNGSSTMPIMVSGEAATLLWIPLTTEIFERSI